MSPAKTTKLLTYAAAHAGRTFFAGMTPEEARRLRLKFLELIQEEFARGDAAEQEQFLELCAAARASPKISGPR